MVDLKSAIKPQRSRGSTLYLQHKNFLKDMTNEDLKEENLGAMPMVRLSLRQEHFRTPTATEENSVTIQTVLLGFY